MIPCLLFGMWNIGYQHYLALGIEDASFIDNFIFGATKVLPIVIVSYIVGLTVEFIFAIIRKHTINEGFLVTGMLIPLVMPVDVPLMDGGVVNHICGNHRKRSFWRYRNEYFKSRHLTARAFLFFAYPTKMSGNEVWINTSLEKGQNVVDGFSGATPLGDAAAGLADKIPGTMGIIYRRYSRLYWRNFYYACLIGAAILYIYRDRKLADNVICFYWWIFNGIYI